MSKSSLLLVDDNIKILDTNAKMLGMKGYEIMAAQTLANAREILAQNLPDLIILDILLPDGSGLDFCRDIHESLMVPVLFLTALGKTGDMLRGYQAGAVDYLAKPYSIDLLLAKTEALLRFSAPSGSSHSLELGRLRMDTSCHRAYIGGRDLLLKPREYTVLELLMKNRGRYLSAEAIYERLWALPAADDVHTVHNHIYILRKRLEGGAVTIESRRNKGYRVKASEE